MILQMNELNDTATVTTTFMSLMSKIYYFCLLKTCWKPGFEQVCD